MERARQLSASKTGEPVSTSEIAKQFLESARDDRLEVVDLLAEPTDSLRHIRRKGEAGMVLSRAEWTAIAHFVRHGLEASPDQTPNPVSRESLIAVLDAFLAVYDLRAEGGSRLDAFYLGNLPPECRPASAKRADRVVSTTSETVRRTVKETRRRVSDPATTWQPILAGRNCTCCSTKRNCPAPKTSRARCGRSGPRSGGSPPVATTFTRSSPCATVLPIGTACISRPFRR